MSKVAQRKRGAYVAGERAGAMDEVRKAQAARLALWPWVIPCSLLFGLFLAAALT